MKKKKNRKQLSEVICPYCGKKAVLRSASYLYGEKRIFTPETMFYVCSGYPECNAYVSANQKNNRPLGTMADGELRNLRIQAHRALREIWTQGYMTKNSTYHWLSGKLALPEKETHVAMFSTYRCMETIRLANELLEERKEMEKENKKASRKEKQNRMILKATEHDMYRLLDYKEKCLIKAGICLGVSGFLGLFLLFPIAFGKVSAYSCFL